LKHEEENGMASVVFSADVEDEGVLELLQLSLTQCMKEAWKGLGQEVAHIRENGLRIGEILRTPPGSLKHESSSSFQCWEICMEDMNVDMRSGLKKVAKALFDRPVCKNLRAIGLD
jgi:hypothetical protein